MKKLKKLELKDYYEMRDFTMKNIVGKHKSNGRCEDHGGGDIMNCCYRTNSKVLNNN